MKDGLVNLPPEPVRMSRFDAQRAYRSNADRGAGNTERHAARSVDGKSWQTTYKPSERGANVANLQKRDELQRKLPSER